MCLFVLYLRQSLVAPFNADGASVVLQGQSMLQGNLLLRGWWLADVTFYTTEVPEYAFVELFRGIGPDVVHIAGALTYTLTVLLGAMLARGRATGLEGIVRALLAGGIMLAPGIIGGTNVLLENPDHAGTAVPVLLLLLIMDRAPERWYVPVAVCGLLAWTQVADKTSLVVAAGPVAAVAVARLLALAARQRPLAEFRFDAMLIAAAGFSIELGKLGERAIRHFGGFVTHPLPGRLLSRAEQVPANTQVMGRAIMLLFGANEPDSQRQSLPLEVIARFHLIGLALAAAGLAVGIATFFGRRMDRVSQILVAGTLALAAAGILGTELPQMSHAHEVAILLPFGAVLAGRTLPGLVSERWGPSRVVLPALAAWLACGLAALSWAATWAPLASQQKELAAWLITHDYTSGLSDYWQANSTTVTSGGAVRIAPLAPPGAADHWESSVAWYDPAQRRANFVIAAGPAYIPNVTLSPRSVRKAFGVPDREYRVGTYVVMVYTYNLLTKLDGRSFPG